MNANGAWFSADWALVIITTIYVAATIFLCIYNRKSAKAAEEQIKQAKIALQKSIDIQLYDKMMSIGNNIDCNDYSNTHIEVSVIFDEHIWEQIETIKQFESYLNNWVDKKKRYEELLAKSDYDFLLDAEADKLCATEELKDLAARQAEKYTVLEDIEGFNPEYMEEPESYNIDEISSNIKRAESEIEKLQAELKTEIQQQIKSKISVETK